MEKKVLMLPSDHSVAQAVQTMVSQNTWSLVVEREGLAVGVVTDRDILRRCVARGLRSESVKLEEIMSSPIITVLPETRIGDIMEKMATKEVRRLYVIEDGKIVGRITQTMMFENSTNVMMTLASMKYQM